MSRYSYNQNQMRHASSAAIVPIATSPIDVVPISSMDSFMDTSRHSFHAGRLNSPSMLMNGYFCSPIDPFGLPAAALTATPKHGRLIDMTLMYGSDVQRRVFVQQPVAAATPRYIDFMNVGTADCANFRGSRNDGGHNFIGHQQNLLGIGTSESRAPLAHFASDGIPKNDGVLGTFKGTTSPISLGRSSGPRKEHSTLPESARVTKNYCARSNSNGTKSLTFLGGPRGPREEISTFYESVRASENYGPSSNFKDTTSLISLGGLRGPRNEAQVLFSSAWAPRYYGGPSSSRDTTSLTSLCEPRDPKKGSQTQGDRAAGPSQHNSTSKSNVANHICIECGRQFESGRALGGHKSSHTKKRQRDERRSRNKIWNLARMRAEAATLLANHMFGNAANRRE